MRVGARTLMVTAGVGSLLAAVVYAAVPRVWFQQRTGEWLAASGRPGDTAFVAYGHPSILEAADMASPYPYLWSVPMRTLDPGQNRLRATLAGARAPTWVVQVNGWNSWGIDDDDRLRDLVAAVPGGGRGVRHPGVAARRCPARPRPDPGLLIGPDAAGARPGSNGPTAVAGGPP